MPDDGIDFLISVDELAEMSKKASTDNALTAAVVPNTSTLLSHSRFPYLSCSIIML